MWKSVAAAACGFVALASAPVAEATTYTITIPGQITSASGPGAINLGDTYTLTTVFDDRWVVSDWGGLGYHVMGTMASFGYPTGTYLPVSGPEFWRIDGSGQTWFSRDYSEDYVFPWWRDGSTGFDYTQELFGPGIAFTDSSVIGLFNIDQWPINPIPRLGGAAGVGVFQNLAGPINATPIRNLGDASFNVYPNECCLGGQYANGVWDYAAAVVTVTPAPEPALWATLIIGFGLIGLRMRSRAAEPLRSR